jgi:hypothetical protein
MADKDKNTKKLKDEKLLGDDLPADYVTFIDNLDPAIITQLVDLKKALKAQGIEAVPIRLDKGTAAAPTKSMPVL